MLQRFDADQQQHTPKRTDWDFEPRRERGEIAVQLALQADADRRRIGEQRRPAAPTITRPPLASSPLDR